MKTRRSQSQLKQLLRRDIVCWWCGVEFEDGTYHVPTRDHLTPKSLGGGDAVTNLVLSCESCNNCRSSIDMVAWCFLVLWVLHTQPDLYIGRVGREAQTQGRIFIQNLCRLGS